MIVVHTEALLEGAARLFTDRAFIAVLLDELFAHLIDLLPGIKFA
jgi:hypothetical protein